MTYHSPLGSQIIHLTSTTPDHTSLPANLYTNTSALDSLHPLVYTLTPNHHVKPPLYRLGLPDAFLVVDQLQSLRLPGCMGHHVGICLRAPAPSPAEQIDLDHPVMPEAYHLVR
jgi:hypothetical protein